jgi:short-subunit dehydrogenase
MENTMKSVCITGASSGFGEESLKAFADKGYKVFGTMRDISTRNSDKKSSLESYSDNISIIEMDVTSDDSVTNALDEIGPIDVLINNAGIMYLGITEAFSIDQAREQMETNYYGAIRTIQAVLPGMRATKSGLIINTSSIVGRVSPPFFGTYSATKHAIEAYSQALRYEVSPFGVDVALVEPGPFGTGLLGAGKGPLKTDVVDSYGEIGKMPDGMAAQFTEFLASEDAPNPRLVVDTYLDLAEMPAGQRPTRTVVGITWGVDEINKIDQPIQDRILSEMQLDGVLSGKS